MRDGCDVWFSIPPSEFELHEFELHEFELHELELHELELRWTHRQADA
jgi:hypothetical protein